MVDKKRENVYVWYSNATDVTGKKIIESLGTCGGNSIPDINSVCMVIGWGSKTNGEAFLENLPVLNHPDRIRDNRNKLNALKIMLQNGVSVPSFCESYEAEEILTGKINNEILVRLPLIGRTKFHQGGKGFWYCPTLTHVREAILEGAQYFQNMVEIKDEYRVHVFKDKAIHAVKKVKRTRDEIEEAFIRQELDRQKKLAERHGNDFDVEMVTMILQRQARRYAENGPDMLIRSNRMGWKFSPANMTDVPRSLVNEAINAVKSIGLDFGAVDCCMAVDGTVAGTPCIIEVNTGPGLEGSAFDKWIDCLRDEITKVLRPEDDQPKEEPVVIRVNVARQSSRRRDEVRNKLSMFGQLLDAAEDDADIEVLNKLISKAFKPA